MTSSRGAIRIETKNAIEDFRWNSAEYERMIRIPIVGDLVKRAIRVQTAAKTGWSAPPSQPGSKPAVRTGLLRGSITWRIGADAISPYVDVGSSVIYAPYVESGTKRMAARPYLRPALQAARVSF